MDMKYHRIKVRYYGQHDFHFMTVPGTTPDEALREGMTEQGAVEGYYVREATPEQVAEFKNRKTYP